MKRLFLLYVLSVICLATSAYEAQIDGIYYNFSNGEASVTCAEGWNDYSGAVTIPSSVTYGGTTYPVTSIEFQAFWGEALTSISIPASVKSIDLVAFLSCTNLSSITVDSANPVYDSRGGCNALIETETNMLIQGSLATVIPSTVTSINNNAFNGMDALTSIDIPDGVTSIGECAFSGTAITTIKLPSGLTSIPYGLFSGCSALTDITIPYGVTTIGQKAFWNCTSLTTVTVPNTVTSIEQTKNSEKAFDNATSLTKVIVNCKDADDLAQYIQRTDILNIFYTNIKDNAVHAIAVDGVEQTTLTIPDGVTKIGGNAFRNCTRLTTVALPEGMTRIGYGSFFGCVSLTEVTGTANVSNIGSSAFQGCESLTSFTTGDNLTSIPSKCFMDCASLASITLGQSVASIGERAFENCPLQCINAYPTTAPTLESDAFSVYKPDVTVYVNDQASYDAYKADAEWAEFNLQIRGNKDATDGHDYVDLGLPSGTLWATTNIGADTPEGFGDYFAWGETTGYNSGKTTFDWTTYKYCGGSYSTLTKYCLDNSYGTVDGLSQLNPEDDAASANWGSSWRIPTPTQFLELLNSDYTIVTSTEQNNVGGITITSKTNGNSIFLPQAGYYYMGDLLQAEYQGTYWTNSIYQYDSSGAFIYDTSIPSTITSVSERCVGRSVRPVTTKDATAIQSVQQTATFKATKRIENGRIVIRKDGKTYSTTGQRIAE